MWPVTDTFRTAVRNSHTVVTRAEVWIGDELAAVVYPTSGSVSIDSRRAVRRTCNAAFRDEDGSLIPGPGGTTGLITAFGTELRLYRGVRHATGNDELVPLGVFVVTKVTQTDAADGQEIRVEGSDRSIRISRNRLRDPYSIADGTAVETVIGDLLRDRWADVPISFPVTGATVGQRVLAAGADSDAWSSAVDIAEANGYDLAFDADGICRMRLIPDPAVDDAEETYADGGEAVVLELSRSFDTSTTYNGVIASSEASSVDSPVRAEAWDEDPNSPTYRYGPFGEVPKFYVSSFLSSTEQATQVATSQLQRELGRTESVEWSQVINPAHDVLDVIRITRPASNLDAVLLIDRLDVPLDAGSTMRAVARVREL